MVRNLGLAILTLGTALFSQSGCAKPDMTQTLCCPSKEVTIILGGNVAMKLVLIPPGRFVMGSPKNEKNHCDDESPQHEVVISSAFYISAYEVTQEQFEQVTGRNPSKFKDRNNPVENVGWDDASEFCMKLSEKFGNSFRLPTEAQWEFACRAGRQTRFCYGDSDDYLGEYAWYPGNSDNKPHPAGTKLPNDFGLYDMHGNVWEWCADWYAPYQPGKIIDPAGPASGTSRVLRGGCWLDCVPQYCRSARRGFYVPDIKTSTVGFRVVAEVQLTPQFRAEASKLIEMLDYDNAGKRQEAYDRLKRMGPAVVPILRENEIANKYSYNAVAKIKLLIESLSVATKSAEDQSRQGSRE